MIYSLTFVHWSFIVTTSTDNNKEKHMNITFKIELDKQATDNDTRAMLEKIAKDSALLYAYKNGLLEKGSYQETHCKLKFG